MDVKALYTNILKNEVIALILTLNNFIFNSKFYFQIKGCAMGTICAPYIRKHINVRVRREIHLSSY